MPILSIVPQFAFRVCAEGRRPTSGTNDTELQPISNVFGEQRSPSRITSSMLQRDAFRQRGEANIHISHTQYIKPKALAAIFIQTAWRGFVCQTDYFIALNDIIIVQTVARRRLATKKVSSLRQEKAEYDAALDIQRSFRGYKGRSMREGSSSVLGEREDLSGCCSRYSAVLAWLRSNATVSVSSDRCSAAIQILVRG